MQGHYELWPHVGAEISCSSSGSAFYEQHTKTIDCASAYVVVLHQGHGKPNAACLVV